MYVYKFEYLKTFDLGVFGLFYLMFWIFFFFDLFKCWASKITGAWRNTQQESNSKCWWQLLCPGIIPGACAGVVNKLDKVPDATETNTPTLNKHGDIVMIIALQKMYRT